MPKGQPGTLTHGPSAYASGRCKCDVCHDAMVAWRRAKYGHRPREVYDAEREAPHGTESRYVNQKCRCGECRAAANEARRQRNANDPEMREKWRQQYQVRAARREALGMPRGNQTRGRVA